MARNYSNTAQPATTTTELTAGATTVQLNNFVGFPAVPFTASLGRGTASEELVLVTAVASDTVTMTRGYDGTTAKAQAVGTTFQHVVVALDFAEAGASAGATTAHVAATSAHGAVGNLVGYGSGTSLPNGAPAGTEYRHTGLGCTMKYNGAAWRQDDVATAASAAARTAISDSYSGLLYDGFMVWQQDTDALWVWTGAAWKEGSGSGGFTITWDVQTYSTAGAFTWTKPSGAVRVFGDLSGGGGGGGGGGASSTSLATGGGGGGRTRFECPAADLASSVTGALGAAGAGGSPQGSGSSGGATTFSGFSAGGGEGGAWFSSIADWCRLGRGGAGTHPGGAGTAFYATTGSVQPPTPGAGAGGGGLGLYIAGGVNSLGTVGNSGGGTGTTAAATSATAPPSAVPVGPGGGGGGTDGSTATSPVSRNGGSGVRGGGGGGGASVSSGTNYGSGGAGGAGYAIIATQCVVPSGLATAVIPQSDKGVAGGVATLDGNGQVSAAQLSGPRGVLAAGSGDTSTAGVTFAPLTVALTAGRLYQVSARILFLDGNTGANTSSAQYACYGAPGTSPATLGSTGLVTLFSGPLADKTGAGMANNFANEVALFRATTSGTWTFNGYLSSSNQGGASFTPFVIADVGASIVASPASTILTLP